MISSYKNRKFPLYQLNTYTRLGYRYIVQTWNTFSGGVRHYIANQQTKLKLKALLSIDSEHLHVPFQENPGLTKPPVRVVAFYLPQFHAIPENDAWWGEGFTEWTNVKPAQPLFEGHYQPRVPEDEIGYYNLLDTEVQRRQILLAKNYGIEGFCFYFYWFNGKTLLEKPVEQYLANRQLDFPFCLCWANESWSRRWDGRDQEILIGQNHSKEDNLSFIKHLSNYLKDDRYIRIDGKPLVVIYRPQLIPDILETTRAWRIWCLEAGIGAIYLAYVQSFEQFNPEDTGFDAAIEFPPNNHYPPKLPYRLLSDYKHLTCNLYDWRMMAHNVMYKPKPNYTLFKGVCPSWDNTPRRKENSTIFIHSNTEGFENWVSHACQTLLQDIQNPEERFLFVNAWNEWAEGATLEADQRYGYAWLHSLYRVLRTLEP